MHPPVCSACVGHTLQALFSWLSAQPLVARKSHSVNGAKNPRFGHAGRRKRPFRTFRGSQAFESYFSPLSTSMFVKTQWGENYWWIVQVISMITMHDHDRMPHDLPTIASIYSPTPLANQDTIRNEISKAGNLLVTGIIRRL